MKSEAEPALSADSQVSTPVPVVGDRQTPQGHALHARPMPAWADNLPDALFCFDQNLRAAYASTAGKRLLGLDDAATIHDKTLGELFIDPDVVGVWQARMAAVLASGREERFHFSLKSGAGLSHFEARLGAERDGRGLLVGVVALVRDDTANFMGATPIPLAFHAALERFLEAVAHELRTPLTSLTLVASSLRRRLAADVDCAAETRRQVDQIGKQADLVLGLLDKFAEASQTRADWSLNAREVDLGEVTSLAAAKVLDRWSNSTMDLRLQEGITGTWDPRRVDQIVTTLLQNAHRFGERRPITVTIEADDTRARILVTDRGIGIAARDQHRIFRKFERGADAQYGGLGLGLWQAHQLVEAMGGTIRVESELGAGATFTVELPRAPITETSIAPTAPKTTPT